MAAAVGTEWRRAGLLVLFAALIAGGYFGFAKWRAGRRPQSRAVAVQMAPSAPAVNPPVPVPVRPKPAPARRTPPAPPPATPPPVVRRFIGRPRLGKILQQVEPEYPPVAKRFHITGRVQVDVIIALDGTIQEAHVISGHLLLREAALNAVKQWRYEPTLLNGVPIEIRATVTVDFNLDQ